jgi:hypothetical protein
MFFGLDGEGDSSGRASLARWTVSPFSRLVTDSGTQVTIIKGRGPMWELRRSGRINENEKDVLFERFLAVSDLNAGFSDAFI